MALLAHDTDRSPFLLPDHYLRHVDIINDDQVEYDMDEQDRAWLDILNDSRRQFGAGPVSPDHFELVMDALEKEWFSLTKDIVKEELAEAATEEAACALCEETDCDNSNAIVYCDGCNLAVHQDCYGVPYIPEGQWLCRRCMLVPGTTPTCALCPNLIRVAAFKTTTNNKWCHLLCAVWIPEVHIENPVYMEPIQYSGLIPKTRWSLNCRICRVKRGACIQCAKEGCFTAFHVTCARQSRFCMQIKQVGGVAINKTFCDKHAPAEYADKLALYDRAAASSNAAMEAAVAGDGLNEADAAMATPGSVVTSKTLLAREDSAVSASSEGVEMLPAGNPAADGTQAASTSRQRYFRRVIITPRVPVYIANLVAERCARKWSKNEVTRRNEFFKRVFKYWTLKRATRPSAPLLKRLHLEPWTAGPSHIDDQTLGGAQADGLTVEERRAARFATVKYLRADFEKLRMLSGHVVNREKKKMRGYEAVREWCRFAVIPDLEYINKCLIELEKYDSMAQIYYIIVFRLDEKDGYFAQPVPVDIAPDYYDVIKEPMNFQTIHKKLDSYRSFDDFAYDVELIYNNCMKYNPVKTVFHKAALRLCNQFESLRKIYAAKIDKIDSESVKTLRTNTDFLLGMLAYDGEPETPQQQRRTLGSMVHEEADRSDEDAAAEMQATPIVGYSRKRSRRLSITEDMATPVRKSMRMIIKESTALEKGAVKEVKVEEQSEETTPEPDVEQHEAHSDSATEGSVTPTRPSRGKTPSSQRKAPKTANASTPPPKKATPRSSTTAATNASIPAVSDLEDTQIVWARVQGFPFHPAEVVIPKKTPLSIPKTVMTATRERNQTVLVLFFSPRLRSWSWMRPDQLRVWDDETHEAMLNQPCNANQRPALVGAFNQVMEMQSKPLYSGRKARRKSLGEANADGQHEKGADNDEADEAVRLGQ